jgi:hypothetical protein
MNKFICIDNSDEIVFKRKSSKKRARYEEDDDFNASDGKNGDEDFVPSRRRYVFRYLSIYSSTTNSSRIINSNSNSRTIDEDSRTMNDHSRVLIDDSRSDARDNDDYDDFGMSDDDTAWRNRRNSSVSSISKKKSNSK